MTNLGKVFKDRITAASVEQTRNKTMLVILIEERASASCLCSIISKKARNTARAAFIMTLKFSPSAFSPAQSTGVEWIRKKGRKQVTQTIHKVQFQLVSKNR